MSRRRIDVVRKIRRSRLAGECSLSFAVAVFDGPRSPASRLLQRMRWPGRPVPRAGRPCGTGFSRERVGCHAAESMPCVHFAMSRRRVDVVRKVRRSRLAGECIVSFAIAVFDRPRSPASRLLQRMRWPGRCVPRAWRSCGTGFSRESVRCHGAKLMSFANSGLQAFSLSARKSRSGSGPDRARKPNESARSRPCGQPGLR